ncbi:hypothetical protein [Salinicoccus sp. CNSTN-B1]
MKTVYEAARHPQPERQRKRKRSKLDTYAEIIDSKLELQCSAYSIYTFIRK